MIKGSCHCGRIAYEIDDEPSEVIACNCSHCLRKGYLLWFIPRAGMRLTTPESALSTYRFNTHAIAHHFCSHCGCAPFGFGSDPSGQATAAVNVRCLEDVDLDALSITPVDGRSR